MIFFTADEHYFHANIIKYCNRPFNSVFEMNEALIANHNKVVTRCDVTYHIGDFALINKDWPRLYAEVIKRLNGKHVFIPGSHDKWMNSAPSHLITEPIKVVKFYNQTIVLCHYPMLSWPKSFHGSWHLFGHVHGRGKGVGLSFDVGVDCNNFTPLSLDQVKDKFSNNPIA